MCDTDWQLTKQLRGWRPPWEGCWLEREPRGGWAWSAFLYEFSSRLNRGSLHLVSAPFTTTLLTTMASRDLTSAFLDRRSATNRRRRAGGSSIGGGSKVVPFGKLLETHT